MAKRARDRQTLQPVTSVVEGPRLPKRALERIHLGQSFAEYDPLLENPAVFVQTPALRAAGDIRNPHCFFVGRRGTGKTTITRFLSETDDDRVIQIRPAMFSPSDLGLGLDEFSKSSQKPFRSLLAAFRRSLQDEVLFKRLEVLDRARTPEVLRREWDTHQTDNFDLRTLIFIADLMRPLSNGDDVQWVRQIGIANQISKEMKRLDFESRPYTVLLDALDDFWDGSELAVVYLSALMHACLEINSQNVGMRVLVFVRENIFERVRLVDSEFSRLETCVVGLDWTREQLTELIERRVNAPLPTKLALGGSTWNAFFEDGAVAKEMVLDYCQHRPRDVLTYCSLALDTAQSHKHDRVMIEDLQDARRRFSDSRLKDLSDEYQENYPQVAVVLESFYGLGRRFTLGGMEDFLRKLLEDAQVISGCRDWIYDYASVERFGRLLYDVGFLGFADTRGPVLKEAVFRSLGPRDTTPPPISATTEFVIHPSYHQALDLQDVLVGSLDDGQTLRRSGIILELPGALNMEEYRELLNALLEDLKATSTGRDTAARFESIVGDVIRLCFFRALHNVQEQVRDIDGTVRRDWVAANRAQFGFWEMMRSRYSASQVTFECKNNRDLEASDFHQACYYMSEAGGRLVFIVYRGEQKKHYFEHIERAVRDNRGLILLLNDKDLLVFLRQALHGKVKDDHLQDRYDTTVRALS